MRAGRCLCTQAGQRLRRLRNKFLQAMKTAFPPASPERGALMAGSIVAHIAWRPATDDGQGASLPADPPLESWLHVGLMYLSPYRPTFMQLSLYKDLEECSPSPTRVYVKASLGVQPWPTN